MQDNRNLRNGLGCNTQGTVCIDTKRVLDCCRDRDCFEDVRVFLTSFGEEVISTATSVRTKCASLIWAYVGVEPVPFNSGFYKVTVRYYIKVELEACVCIGKSQCFSGIAVLEKDVILFGGEGNVVSYYSNEDNNYCNIGNINTTETNAPVAVVETVTPIVLSTKVVECCNPCINSCGCECSEIPACICNCIDGQLVTSTQGNTPRLVLSFGIFSVVRIERPAQLLVEATDYSVPDKECTPATSSDNPCTLFSAMPFPVGEFKTVMTPPESQCGCGGTQKSCGCGNNR